MKKRKHSQEAGFLGLAANTRQIKQQAMIWEHGSRVQALNLDSSCATFQCVTWYWF
jgi:hypothetical protein